MLNPGIRPAAALAMLALVPPLAAQEAEQKPPKPSAAQEIAAAITTANAKNKRALIAFLGDDAVSRSLDEALRKDRTLSRQLLYEFVIARADAAKDAALAKERGADLAELGTPAVLVLDGTGHLIAELNKNAFWSEEKGVEPETLGGVLKELHAEPLDAEKLLSGALKTCKETGKNLLLHFDAPW